jgi:hypothetical protein
MLTPAELVDHLNNTVKEKDNGAPFTLNDVTHYTLRKRISTKYTGLWIIKTGTRKKGIVLHLFDKKPDFENYAPDRIS